MTGLEDFYVFAADDLEASVAASRVAGRLDPRPAGWLIMPMDPAPSRRRRMFNWWAPRMRLYRVRFHNP
jgi:hypothetical protein